MGNHRQFVSRRSFLSTSSALAVGSCCAGTSQAAETPDRGDFAGTEFGCMELEPFRDEPAYEQSLKMAGSQIANAEENVQAWQETFHLPEDLTVRQATEAMANSQTADFETDSVLVQGAPIDELNTEDLGDLIPQRMALMKAKIWDRNRTIRIFIERTSRTALRNAIHDAIQIWGRVIATRLDPTASRGSNDIHIGYKRPGFFSAVGTDSRVASFRRRYGLSLNINDRAPNYDEDKYRAVALHELGHALGAVHEHQSPESNIPWDEGALLRHYRQAPNRWNLDKVRYQITRKFNRIEITNSAYDEDSIMLYPVLEKFLRKDAAGRWKRFVTGWNRELSTEDKRFMQKLYGAGDSGDVPDRPPDPVLDRNGRLRISGAKPLGLNAQIDGEITEYAEQHVYSITVRTRGRYVIETVENSPSINMKLELFEEGKLDKPRASKAYGGARLLNALISEVLDAGTYYVRASHRNAPGKGKYTIHFHN